MVQVLFVGYSCCSRKFAQFPFSAETSEIHLERIIEESQHSSCSLYTTTLPLLKATLVSTFDAVTKADLRVFSGVAAETFSLVLKKGLTCATF